MAKAIKKIKTAHGVSEYKLDNGLRILHKHDKGAPVVAVCVTFHVGSRNESKGLTGATHILEHLLFKDSKKFNKANGNNITDYLEWFGAYINATTWLDRTNYFELLPRERLAEALELEADRFRGSLFNDADLSSEMTVVRNEFERSRNNPFELLDEEILYKVFEKHPYRIPTIGLKEDIEDSTAAKLRSFYDTFYWPENATLSVYGDVPWKKVEKLVSTYFGSIPKAPRIISKHTVKEPDQKSPRSVDVKKSMGVTIAELSYKVPAATDKDFPAVYVLMALLGGGFASRLQHALIDTGYASGVSTFCFPLFDPGFANITAQCTSKLTPEEVLQLMRKEVARIADGVQKEELDRAKERILAEGAMERDGVFTEIRATSESTAAGDWTLGYRFPKEVAKLTNTDIKRVAKKYFTKSKETSGILKPE